jgi:hypothetical protein
MSPRLIKFIVNNIRGIETLALPINFLIGIYMKFFVRVPPIYLSRSYNWFSNCNWIPVMFHYYQPTIKMDMLPENYEQIENSLIGVDLDVKNQVDLLSKFHYNEELEEIPLDRTRDFQPYYNNVNFQCGDAEILYNMIRHYKPSKLIEIGSGDSTKFARAAIEQNKRDNCSNTEHICIEPFEQPWLENLGVSIIRERVEGLDPSIFKKLAENDILFIDSSHVVRTQGDVVYEYLTVIPSLRKGVIIHSHDIFLPREYPLQWINGWKRFWNEQYLLQALLAHSSRYKPLLALNFLARHHRNELESCCPIFRRKKGDIKLPCSFWFQVSE